VTPILQCIQPSQAWQLDPDIAFFATAIDRCRATLSIIAIESKYVNVSCRNDSIHALMQIRETGPNIQGCQMHLAAKRFECLRPLALRVPVADHKSPKDSSASPIN
jgi:hypothetical protein